MKEKSRVWTALICMTLAFGSSGCQAAPAPIPSPATVTEAVIPLRAPTELPPAIPTETSVASPTIVASLTPPPSPQPGPTVQGVYCAGPKVHLDIPDRDEDENAPEDGWCGETSIQMAMDYYGKAPSQYAIHLAGKPKHPDLWEDEIPVALETLGVNFEAWDTADPDLNGYITWIGEQLHAGYPLLLGVKIYPDETGWDNDHFVLAVGCDTEGIYINTNNAGDGQYYATYDELTDNFEDSYSFVNADNTHYGWAIHGLR